MLAGKKIGTLPIFLFKVFHAGALSTEGLAVFLIPLSIKIGSVPIFFTQRVLHRPLLK
jgi:hypothetical protein